MNPSQNDAFGSLSNGQGGGVQAGGISGGVNNDSGGKVYSQMPIGSVSTGGPIVIKNGSEKKSKLWVVVPVVILLFVVVIGVIIAVSKNKNNENDVMDNFNKMANFILYGENKSDDIGEYNKSKNYYFSDEATIYGNNKQYFEEVENYYKDFMRDISDKYSAASDLGDIISFFSAYSKFNVPTVDVLSEGYNKNGTGIFDEYLVKKNQIFDYSNKISSEYMVLFDSFLNESLFLFESGSDNLAPLSFAYRRIALFLLSKSSMAESLCFELKNLLNNVEDNNGSV